MKKSRIRHRKDTDETMGTATDGGGTAVLEQEDESITGQGGEEKDRTLLNVKASRTYKLVEPPKEANLDPRLDIPDSSLGRAARDLILITRAEKEIKADKSATKKRLLQEMRKARKTDVTYQLGKTPFQLIVTHTDAREDVKIKTA